MHILTRFMLRQTCDNKIAQAWLGKKRQLSEKEQVK